MIELGDIGIKQARYIVAKHYSVDPAIAVRKLLKLIAGADYVPGEARSRATKTNVVIAEAKRIESLRSNAGVNTDTCMMCGRHDGPKKLKVRHDLAVTTPKRFVSMGWKLIDIQAPLLCRTCWKMAAIDVYQYRFLINLQMLCKQLENTRHE